MSSNRPVLRGLIFLAALWFAPTVSAAPLDQFQDCDHCPVMIELPLGEFVMGQRPGELTGDFRRKLDLTLDGLVPTPKDQPYTKTDEGPLHRVIVDIPIAMGMNEVTFQEWHACVDDGGCGGFIPRDWIGLMRPGGGKTTLGPKHPVLNISYPDIQRYIEWLNTKSTTGTYRLPTEAEWEYAARATTTTRFAQGDELSTDQANFSADQTQLLTQTIRPDWAVRGAPVPVDTLDAANAWGLRHMAGNMSEYTMSCYTERYAGWDRTSRWLLEAQREDCLPVIRGGDYDCPMDCARSAWRARFRDPDFRGKFAGFRVVKELSDGRSE